MRRGLLLLFCVAVTFGCGVQSAREAARMAYSVDSELAVDSAGEQEAAEDKADPTQFQRKIIYNATIDLVVSDFAAAEAAIPALVEQHGGYLADVSLSRSSGSRRTGLWKSRIPVDQFEQFMDDVSKLGFAEKRSQTAEDVTEQFVDLEARIANKKQLEERILKLLDNSEGKIKDIIEVERELARVRSEVEQMEGRLRFLTNQTDLTTVTIRVREEQNYVPPEAPTFGLQIAKAWKSSWRSLRIFGEQVVVALVYASPWIVLIGLLMVPVIWSVRRRRRTRS